jgi:hypothetical protein
VSSDRNTSKLQQIVPQLLVSIRLLRQPALLQRRRASIAISAVVRRLPFGIENRNLSPPTSSIASAICAAPASGDPTRSIEAPPAGVVDDRW